MASSVVVFYKVAATCLIIFVGFLFRRMKILPENSVSFISKFMMSMALPSFMIYYMPSSISTEMLSAYWYYPFLAAFLLAVLDVFGYGAAKLFAVPGEEATFRMLVAVPNWVFMALAVCEPLFRQDGVRVVLLFNIGFMVYLWTFGMTGFRPATGVLDIMKKLFLNTQTIAIFIGLVIAFTLPVVRGMEKLASADLAALPFPAGLLSPIWDTVYLTGSTAMPLAILQIGMLLGAPEDGTKTEGKHEMRSLILATLLRLLVAPVIGLAAQTLLFQFGILTDRAEFVTSAIILSMPAAVLTFTVTEVHKGATALAARMILWSTVASLLTAPVMTLLAETVYSRLA